SEPLHQLGTHLLLVMLGEARLLGRSRRTSHGHGPPRRGVLGSRLGPAGLGGLGGLGDLSRLGARGPLRRALGPFLLLLLVRHRRFSRAAAPLRDRRACYVRPSRPSPRSPARNARACRPPASARRPACRAAPWGRRASHWRCGSAPRARGSRPAPPACAAWCAA